MTALNDQQLTTLVSAYVLTVVSGMIICLRLLLRWLKKETFKTDDWLMLAAFPLYIVNTAFYQIIVPDGSNLVADPDALSDEEIATHQFGAIFALAGRPFYMSYIWVLKACILIYYTRLTSRTSELKIVYAAGILLVLTWIGCMLSFFLACRPFSGYFQVKPTPGPACTTASAAVITQGTTEIATALLLMAIPLPIIIRARLPLKTKIQLCAVFLFGSFDIVISIMRMVIVLQNLTQLNKLIWGQLECFAATVVANAPIIWGLYRHGRKQRSNGAGNMYGSNSLSHSGNNHMSNQRENKSVMGSAIRMNRVSKNQYSSWVKLQDEALTGSDSSTRVFTHSDKKGGIGIERTVEVKHETHSIDDEQDMEGQIGVVRTAIYGFDDEPRHAR